ncbi:hypothetical protein BHM03_00037550, partial [Ensete ventricosum]
GGRLEATAAAREDGFRLWSHDREEEWARVTQLRAGRQQWQRRRQRLWLVMAATAGKRLGSTGSDSYSGDGMGSSGDTGMVGGGGKEERNRDGRRRKRRPREEKTEEGLAAMKKAWLRQKRLGREGGSGVRQGLR